MVMYEKKKKKKKKEEEERFNLKNRPVSSKASRIPFPIKDTTLRNMAQPSINLYFDANQRDLAKLLANHKAFEAYNSF